MHIFLDEIRKRMERLGIIIEEKRIALENAPKGVINIDKTDEKTQYYYKESSSDMVRKYLKNSEVHIAEEFYWEHLGRMDDTDYVEKNLNKITNYEKNNIFPGDRLILTHETSRCPINSKIIEKIIHTYLL